MPVKYALSSSAIYQFPILSKEWQKSLLLRKNQHKRKWYSIKWSTQFCWHDPSLSQHQLNWMLDLILHRLVLLASISLLLPLLHIFNNKNNWLFQNFIDQINLTIWDNYELSTPTFEYFIIIEDNINFFQTIPNPPIPSLLFDT